jgi:hypothetical protein
MILALEKLMTWWLTVCVSRWWAGRDSLREQKKPEARKMLENAAESHRSAARFVGTLLTLRLVHVVTGFISRQRG